MIELTEEWFSARWAEARNRAGKRYSPELNVDLPLAAYFDSACQSEVFFGRFAGLGAALDGARRSLRLDELAAIVPGETARACDRLLAQAETAFGQLLALQGQRPAALPIETVLRKVDEADRALGPIARILRDRQDRGQRGPKSAADRQFGALLGLRGALRGISHALANPVSSCSNGPHILLLGSAGTGKTHLLCEMTHRRIEARMPALLFFGQAFQAPFTDALDALVHSILPTSNSGAFLLALDGYARDRSTRCLISIDAVNEGHRPSWSRGLPDLINAIRRYPALALVVGCRTPFEQILAPSPEALHLRTVVHHGFPPDEQTAAIEKYFKAYDIPIPEVTLLEDEFANPLFLHLFCQALEQTTQKKKHAQIQGIASGQRGMTYILENFVKHKGRIISRRLGLDAALPWRFLKSRIAPRLAANHAGALSLVDVSALADAEQPPGMAPGALLRELINEDILAEDVAFDGGTPREIVRCTYQTFADHLVARHILRAHLDSSTPETILASLRDPAGLGAYFVDHNAALARVNLVQALMVEFPTRIHNRGELLDYLGWRSSPLPLCRAFLAGLYWREPRSINESTDRIVTAFLGNEDLREETLNVLLALSVKPEHPFQARWLDAFLGRQGLVARDLFWSEYLRRGADRGTPGRILIWAEHFAPRAPLPEYVSLYITVLKWFLTSTRRGLRDRATHALFRLGRTQPKLLFEEAVRSLALDDAYVPQRMLAASYGVTMSLWQQAGNVDFQTRTLPRFARQLYGGMFARNARFGTTHVLSREYAQGIIQLALLVAPKSLSATQQRRVLSPFRRRRAPRWRETNDRDENRYRDGDAPLGMDFANYTLGRLVRDRDAYDDQHSGYQRVKRQVFWRIYKLGYTLDAFSAVDREIARQSWRAVQGGQEGDRVDRYGKKYAWIAYYELAGCRMDLGLMDASERLSDVDIDPSFPEPPDRRRVFCRPWIETGCSVKGWMLSGYQPDVKNEIVLQELDGRKGSWVMIDGFVTREAVDKTIFALFSASFVRAELATQLVGAIRSMEYPGIHNIPRPEEEHYTYAGEIPWAETWHRQEDQKSVDVAGAPIPVCLPVRIYSWEDYHSSENRAGGMAFVSKEIGEELGLYVQTPWAVMAVRGTARIATLATRWGSPYHDYESLLYMRQDLLDGYLRKHRLVFVMTVWGERRGNYHLGDAARESEGDFTIQQVLHKQVFTYGAGIFERVWPPPQEEVEG